MTSETEIVKKLVEALSLSITVVNTPYNYSDSERKFTYREMKQALTEGQAYLERQGKCGEGWQPIETFPHNMTVLVHYKNGCGKSRVVKARYIDKYTEENHSGEDWCDYNEENDTYYDREGWYEEIDNWPDYSHVAFCEGAPDAWQHLPKPPTTSQQEGG